MYFKTMTLSLKALRLSLIKQYFYSDCTSYNELIATNGVHYTNERQYLRNASIYHVTTIVIGLAT